jgi:O-antigen/teichoic acid export membrane protein
MSQHRRKILRGSAANVVRVIVSLSFALILPPLLVHRMAPAEYGAWLLIMQGTAYIGFLDLGMQTAIAKYVAEYDAAGDFAATRSILSSSFALLCVSGLIGVVAIAILAWLVPELFGQMPYILVPSMREGILLVGLSSALALPLNAFLATFTGLQKYTFPAILAISTKCLASVALMTTVVMRGGLIQMAAVMAASTIASAGCQFLGWRKYISKRVSFSLNQISREWALRLAKFGSVLSVWTIGMLFVSGLDMVIVGHYDYGNTAYYGVATSVTNFLLLVIASMFGPLGPAVSSIQSGRTAGQLGEIVVTATRLSTLLLCLTGLPIFLGAYPLLGLWVGSNYGNRSATFLQVLIVGNAIRQLGYPYALVVIATGKQYQATIAAVAEALTNLTVSIYLAQKIGAIGVAIGTLIGAIVSIGVHIVVSMTRTRSTVSISRRHYVLDGILRPLTCIAPSILLLPLWTRSMVVAPSPYLIVTWIFVTLTIAWFVVLVPTERLSLKNGLFRLLCRNRAPE